MSKIIDLADHKQPLTYTYLTLDDMADEKKFNKFIEYVEKLIRKSKEYKDYIKFCKKERGMYKDAFMNSISSYDELTGKFDNRIKIEIHHYPFSLYTIVKAVINYNSYHGNIINPYVIAEQVMSLHGQNLIGLVPLCRTTHKLTHDEKLFIPLDMPRGDYETFYGYFNKHMSDDCRALYSFRKTVDDTYNHKNNTAILDVTIQEYSIDGELIPLLPNLELEFEEYKEKIYSLREENKNKRIK